MPTAFATWARERRRLGAQLAQAYANGVERAVRDRAQQAIALKQLHDRGSVQAAHLAQEARPLKQFDVFRAVQAVLAGGAVRTGEAEALPGTNHRRGNTDQACHIADFQVRFSVRRFHSRTYAPRVFCDQEERYFLLDSLRRLPLTLRDYSKVCFCTQALRFRKIETSTRQPEIPHDFVDSALRQPFWLAVLFCLVCSTFLLGPKHGGRILGRVADPSGAVLANVKVPVVNEATGSTREAQTNDSGDYALVEVQPGSLPGGVRTAGFKKNVQKNVIVEVNQVVTLNAPCKSAAPGSG